LLGEGSACASFSGVETTEVENVSVGRSTFEEVSGGEAAEEDKEIPRAAIRFLTSASDREARAWRYSRGADTDEEAVATEAADEDN